MPIPQLNQYGLLPVGIHLASMDDVYARFCTSSHRWRLWQGLHQYINKLESCGALDCVSHIYIDGSYISDKRLPADIDVCFYIPQSADAASCVKLFEAVADQAGIKAKYGVHPFIQIEGLAGMDVFFQRLREKDAMHRSLKLLPKTAQKGIVRCYYEQSRICERTYIRSAFANL